MQGISINDLIQDTGFSTIEKDAIRRVMREELGEEFKQGGGVFLQNISRHSKAMQEILGSPDYEALCLHQLMHNTKHLSVSEQIKYTSAIEDFAKAYAAVYTNKKLLLLMLSGLVHTTHDAKSVRKYAFEIYNDLLEKKKLVSKSAEAEAEKLSELRHELEAAQLGIFKIFRISRIRLLNRKIRQKAARLRRLEKRLSLYDTKARNVLSIIQKP
ncbi:MAG: hypothetical protein ACP5T3_01210 [Candidatus Micrarchaeia archaeon]